MATYTVTYTSSNGQPHQEYGGPYTSRKAAIAAARECARECLLGRSGGHVSVYADQWGLPPIWWWEEHFEGGYGGQEGPDGVVASVRL